MPYKLSMSNHNSNNKKYKNIVTTRSSWSPPHHFRRCGNNTDGGGRGICTHSSTSMKDEHGDTFVPPPSRFLFCIVVIFPTREMMGNSQRVPTSQRAAIRFSFFSFFCLLIFIPFCKVVRVIIPIRLPRRPSSGQPVVGNTRPRHKKEPGNPGRMGTLIPCLCHRSQNVFSASKTLDILLDNEQVVSIYKERIFIPPPRSITECCGV